MSIKGNTYQHKKRKSIYVVLFEGQMKENGEWVDSVTYQDPYGRVWTRKKEEFLDGRFDLLEEKP